MGRTSSYVVKIVFTVFCASPVMILYTQLHPCMIEKPSWIGTINFSTFSRSFKEWKFCCYEIDQLAERNWMECPPCSQGQHSAHVDGNMKLYRFSAAGSQQRESYYMMRHASALYRREFARLKSNPTNKEIQTELIIPAEATLTVNVIRHLKAAMQNAHYSIAQLSLNIAKLADSSKQRSRLRKKISQEKRGLKELVSSYNGKPYLDRRRRSRAISFSLRI
ncbi:uncharacterized protein LOC125561919 isoform X1 [Nematostella vectensis]|uniref:uncharacterized protein LOC125561919 isoform X1 n=1 Tax=Nematostella vectensis TaxID=45351 RepID=UPI002077837F|nr:uncharacterized protein LOC125561919 isoform X1 [Nematostella vectensis]XP_048582766.1 uncharacterized protein LOC125561919 isoform X1 [Nematostella vectensis]